MINITKVNVYPYNKTMPKHIVGIGQVIINNAVMLTGLELVDDGRARYVRYPKNKFNSHKLCFCQPINRETTNLIATKLFEEYDIVKNNKNAKSEYVNIGTDDYMANAVEDLRVQLEQDAAVMRALANEESNGPNTVNNEELEIVE